MTEITKKYIIHLIFSNKKGGGDLSIEVIKVIKDTENAAESIKKDAYLQSKQIIMDANSNATKIVEDAINQVAINRKNVFKVTESESQILYEKIIEEATNNCTIVKEKASRKINEAADIILERIVKSNGNS